MTISFPVIICFLGAIPFFTVATRLRRFRVPAKPPTNRAHLSIDDRQRRIRIASWISFASGCVMLAGALLLARLGHTPN